MDDQISQHDKVYIKKNKSNLQSLNLSREMIHIRENIISIALKVKPPMYSFAQIKECLSMVMNTKRI